MSNIYDDIEEWIDRISKNKNNYQICPYANKAKYLVFTNEDMLSMQIKASFYNYNTDLILCIPTDKFMSVDTARYIERNCNKTADNTITLLDHPDDPGYVDDICTSNGKHIIFLIQPKKELLKARENLKTTNYYDKWSEEYYNKICHPSSY